MRKKVLLLLMMCFVLANSQNTQRYSAIAKDLMYELQGWYQQEKVTLFIDKLDSKKAQERLDEQVEEFFASERFVETGASYLTSLFTDKELSELRQAIRNGALTRYDANYPAVQKLHFLFKKLDPYLYQFLEQQFVK